MKNAWRVYQVDNVEELREYQVDDSSSGNAGMRNWISGDRELLERATHICREIDGPYFYETALESDSLLLKGSKRTCRQRGTIIKYGITSGST